MVLLAVLFASFRAWPAGATSVRKDIPVGADFANSVTPGKVLPMMFQTGTDPEFSTARVRPQNSTGQSGVNLGSRNYNWSLPLVSLAGRAGMDLNLTLYYNSLVWTKQGMTAFNLNKGFPGWVTGGHRGAGFELHLPFLQQRYTRARYRAVHPQHSTRVGTRTGRCDRAVVNSGRDSTQSQHRG